MVFFQIISLFTITYFLNLNFVNEIFTSIFNQSASSNFSNLDRLNILNLSLSTFFDNPFGVGVDCFNLGSNIDSKSSENAFLTIFVERGLLPGILFLFLILKLIKKDSLSYNLKNLILCAFTIFIYFMFNYEYNNIFMNFFYFLTIYEANKINSISIVLPCYNSQKVHFMIHWFRLIIKIIMAHLS